MKTFLLLAVAVVAFACHEASAPDVEDDVVKVDTVRIVVHDTVKVVDTVVVHDTVRTPDDDLRTH